MLSRENVLARMRENFSLYPFEKVIDLLRSVDISFSLTDELTPCKEIGDRIDSWKSHLTVEAYEGSTGVGILSEEVLRKGQLRGDSLETD